MLTLHCLYFQKRLVNFLKQTGRTKGGAITDHILSLGTLTESMSIEQIASIKAKRLAKKRGTIKTDDLEGGGVSFVMASWGCGRLLP